MVHHAAKYNRVAELRAIVSKGASLYSGDRWCMTPLHYAAELIDTDEIISYMLEQEKELLDASNLDDETALHFACRVANIKAVRILIEAGARFDIQDRNGEYAIHTACRYAGVMSSLDVVKYLVEIGCPLDIIGPYNQKPLHIAARFRNLALVEFIVDQGVDVNDCDSDGWTAYQYAWRNNDRTMMDYLVDHGAQNLKPPTFTAPDQFSQISV